MSETSTLSTRGFLTKAIYDWIEQSDNTSYLVVNAMVPGTLVPEEHIKEGRILFNISSKAVRYLEIDAEYISFTAKFHGEPMNMFIPIQAVVSRDNTHYVYVVKRGKKELREVEIGKFNTYSIEIVSGLEVDEELLLYAEVELEADAKLKKSPLAEESKKKNSDEKDGNKAGDAE